MRTAKSSIRNRTIQDLKKSGLSDRDMRKLKIVTLTANQTATFLDNDHYKYESYEIPYFDIHGKETGFKRIRFLEDVVPESPLKQAQGFKKNKEEGKQPKIIRYSQPHSSGCHIYIPPLVDWEVIAKDPSIPIIITEGEKKAAKACKENFPCLALGGVWSFLQDKTSLITDFSQFQWRGRRTIICYDNDLATNDDVLEAEKRLAAHLLFEKGARIFTKRIPFKGEKMGIDDLLVSKGGEYFKRIKEVETHESKVMSEMKEKVVWVQSLNSYICKESRTFIPAGKQTTAFNNMTSHYSIIDHRAKMKGKEVRIGKATSDWPGLDQYIDVCYSPGKEETINGSFNMWSGYGVEPEKGDIKPFKDLVNHVLERCNKEEKDYFWQWLAYPLQNPGVKVKVGTLIFGLTQGTGKSFIGVVLGEIYGNNYIKITQSALDTPFNSWSVNKQFIMGEEISGTDKRKHNNEVKDMLTRETITVNRKFEPEYQVKDCANYYFTSNHPDAVFLEDGDRRFFILEGPKDRLPQRIVTAMNKWRKAGGASHLMYHLIHNVDCKDFSEFGPAPMTQFKMDMMHISRSELEQFAQDLKENPREVLLKNGEFAGKCWYDIEELMWFYDPTGTKKVSKIAFSKALRRYGFKTEAKNAGGKSKRIICIVDKHRTWKDGRAGQDYLSVQIIPDRRARLSLVKDAE